MMESPGDVSSFDLVVPLCPFERHLLDVVRRTYTEVLDCALCELREERGEGFLATNRSM
jgi:hypothetical protein